LCRSRSSSAFTSSSWGVAAALFIAPLVALVLAAQAQQSDVRLLLVLVICWIPAALLASSVFTTGRPRFVPPRRRLQREEAPALFAMIQDLAARAGTAVPGEVYLEIIPNLAVAEVGGLFRSRRVMLVGAPLVRALRVDELRAVLAHELGHFTGGDTRLTAFTVQTHALFASVVSTVERDPFLAGTRHYAVEGGLALAEAIGRAVVGGYGRLFLWITMPTSRRQELAADSLAARLVGKASTVRALETSAVVGPLYGKYLHTEVGFAVSRGAMPTDLWAGFDRLRERVLANDSGRALLEAARQRATDRYDTHPSLADRLRALDAHPDVALEPDDRPAVALFADPDALDAWLVEATRDRIVAAAGTSGRVLPPVRSLPWSSIPGEVYAPAAKEGARRTAERLHPLFPSAATFGAMFAAVWRGLEGGKMADIALRMDPGLARMPRYQAERAATRLYGELIATLLQGALLERGAFFEDSVGEPALVLRLGDERVVPAEILQRLAVDGHAGRLELESWAKRLESAVLTGPA
jgi:Zn-dependent protease with chaperone function